MCSLNLNSTINEQIEGDSSIEKKLMDLAFEATTENPGPLDETSTHRKRMPQALREIRKRRTGLHRLYYSGHHSNCFYDACFLQTFKQGDSGNELDDDQTFQNHLITALRNNIVVRVLQDPKNVQHPSQETIPDYQDTAWFKEQQKYLVETNIAEDTSNENRES